MINNPDLKNIHMGELYSPIWICGFLYGKLQKERHLYVKVFKNFWFLDYRINFDGMCQH